MIDGVGAGCVQMFRAVILNKTITVMSFFYQKIKNKGNRNMISNIIVAFDPFKIVILTYIMEVYSFNKAKCNQINDKNKRQ